MLDVKTRLYVDKDAVTQFVYEHTVSEYGNKNYDYGGLNTHGVAVVIQREVGQTLGLLEDIIPTILSGFETSYPRYYALLDRVGFINGPRDLYIEHIIAIKQLCNSDTGFKNALKSVLYSLLSSKRDMGINAKCPYLRQARTIRSEKLKSQGKDIVLCPAYTKLFKELIGEECYFYKTN